MQKELLIEMSSLRQTDIIQTLPTKAFLNKTQILRRLNTARYALSAMEFMEKNQPERYMELMEQGELLTILWEVQIEAKNFRLQAAEKLSAQPNIQKLSYWEKTQEMATQMALIEQQIMREIVLVQR